MPEVIELFPSYKVIDRTSMNSWLDPAFRKAVAATGRKKFVLCGLWTEACVMFPTLDMLKEGYEIYIPADACGDLSRGAQPLDGSRGPCRSRSDHNVPVRF